MPRGRTKGSKNIAPEARAFVARIEDMLRRHDPKIEDLERLACRLLTHDAHEAMETKFFAEKGIVTDSRDVISWSARLKAAEIAMQIWRTLMQYKHGMPKQSIEGELSVNLTGIIEKARKRAE